MPSSCSTTELQHLPKCLSLPTVSSFSSSFRSLCCWFLSCLPHNLFQLCSLPTITLPFPSSLPMFCTPPSHNNLWLQTSRYLHGFLGASVKATLLHAGFRLVYWECNSKNTFLEVSLTEYTKGGFWMDLCRTALLYTSIQGCKYWKKLQFAAECN